MKAVVMAGGKGSRLRPLTNDIPKPMVRIIDKPVLECILELLKEHGITEVGITLGYKGDVIKRYFGNGKDFGVKLEYFSEEIPLGSAGGVRNALNFIDDRVLVVSGDSYTNMDLSALVKFHIQKNALASMALYPTEDARGFGLVETDEEGRVISFKEKPSVKCPGKINTGIYVLEKSLVESIPLGFCDFGKDVFPNISKGLFATETEGFWSDIGTLESYYLTNRYVAVNILEKAKDFAA